MFRALLFAALVSGPVAIASADEVSTLTFIESGASSKIGYYSPQRLKLSDQKPDTLKKTPDGLEAPLYGVITVAGVSGRVFHVILDEPSGKDARLFVDSNGDGDLTNDATPDWKGKKTPARGEGAEANKEFTMYAGGATIALGTADKPVNAHLSAYRFDKTDPTREQLKDVLLYYRDYAVEGQLSVGGKSYKAMLDDGQVTGDFRGTVGGRETDGASPVTLLIDVNGNGKFDHQGESFPVNQPFNIGGTTWELVDISADGTRVGVRKSDKTVAEVATPPDLGAGKTIPAFEATTMDGKAVKFPSDYKGKIVLLDFWATWCGPCMAEMPNVSAAYDRFHSKGFEILGVTLDNKDAAEKIKKVAGEKNMPWPQIYDGGGWKAAIAVQYAINSIPRAFLVDGDTGNIIAAGDAIRGEALAKAIEDALAQRGGSAK